MRETRRAWFDVRRVALLLALFLSALLGAPAALLESAKAECASGECGGEDESPKSGGLEVSHEARAPHARTGPARGDARHSLDASLSKDRARTARYVASAPPRPREQALRNGLRRSHPPPIALRS